MKMNCSRREFLGALGMTAGAYMTHPKMLSAMPAPASRVAIGMCAEYNRNVVDTLSKMFDQMGGLESIVRGKTVAIKLNMTGLATDRMRYMPPGVTHWVHPAVIGATVHLMGRAGARRIRLLESAWSTAEPLEEFMIYAGWRPEEFLRAAPRVEFENTNYLGSAKKYSRFMVPGGGLMFAGYDLNHSYEDCDVFASLAKLKQHRTAGVTLSMKNCFGLTPATIYAQEAPEDEPNRMPVGYRMAMHLGSRKPPQSAPPAVNLTNHDPGYRVPRIVVDLVSSRPVHLAVIDGVYSMEGGELPNQGPKALHRATHPGVLIAGLNCVSTDAVATAVMGFDPMADRGTPPFETCDNTLRIAEQHGVGTCDLKRIEVVGTSIAKARFPYKTLTQLTRA